MSFTPFPPKKPLLINGARLMVRFATAQDAVALSALDQRCSADGAGMVTGPDEYSSPDDYRQRIDTCSILVALVGEQLVGELQRQVYGPLYLRHMASVSLIIDPSYRSQGIGDRLMTLNIEDAKRQGLERLDLAMRADNQPAKRLYKRHGFVHEGTRKRFLKLGPDHYVDDEIWALDLTDHKQ